jgi:hypothetical protein
MQWSHFFHEDDEPRLDVFLAVSESAFDFASLVPPWGRGHGTVLDWLVFGTALGNPTVEYSAAYIEVVRFLHLSGVPCIVEVSFENLQRRENRICARRDALRLLGVVAAGRTIDLKDLRDLDGFTALDWLLDAGAPDFDDHMDLFTDTVPPDPQQHFVLKAAKLLGAHGLTAQASLETLLDRQFGMLWQPGDQVSSESLYAREIDDERSIFLIMAAGLAHKLLDLGRARCEDYLNYLVHQAMLGGAWLWVRKVLEHHEAVTTDVVGKIRLALEQRLFQEQWCDEKFFDFDYDEVHRRESEAHRRWDLALSWHRHQMALDQLMVNTLLQRLLYSIPGVTLQDEVVRRVDSFLYALRINTEFFEVWKSTRR